MTPKTIYRKIKFNRSESFRYQLGNVGNRTDFSAWRVFLEILEAK